MLSATPCARSQWLQRLPMLLLPPLQVYHSRQHPYPTVQQLLPMATLLVLLTLLKLVLWLRALRAGPNTYPSGT